MTREQRAVVHRRLASAGWFLLMVVAVIASAVGAWNAYSMGLPRVAAVFALACVVVLALAVAAVVVADEVRDRRGEEPPPVPHEGATDAWAEVLHGWQPTFRQRTRRRDRLALVRLRTPASCTPPRGRRTPRGRAS